MHRVLSRPGHATATASDCGHARPVNRPGPIIRESLQCMTYSECWDDDPKPTTPFKVLAREEADGQRWGWALFSEDPLALIAEVSALIAKCDESCGVFPEPDPEPDQAITLPRA